MKKVLILILVSCMIFSGCGKNDNIKSDKHNDEKALGEPNTPFDSVQDVQSQAEVTTTEAVITTTAPNVTTTAPTTTAPKTTEPVNDEIIILKNDNKFFNVNDEIVFMSNNNTERGFKLKVTDIKLVNDSNLNFMEGYSTKIKMTVIFTPYQYYYTNPRDIFAITDIPSIKRYHMYNTRKFLINTPKQYDIYFYSNSDKEFVAMFSDCRYLNFYIKYKINPKALNS